MLESTALPLLALAEKPNLLVGSRESLSRDPSEVDLYHLLVLKSGLIPGAQATIVATKVSRLAHPRAIGSVFSECKE